MSHLETCQTCKHWGGPVAPSDYNEHGQAACKHPKVGACGSRYRDGAEDAEAYGGILTGPDFGCIHWEGKDS